MSQIKKIQPRLELQKSLRTQPNKSKKTKKGPHLILDGKLGNLSQIWKIEPRFNLLIEELKTTSKKGKQTKKDPHLILAAKVGNFRKIRQIHSKDPHFILH